MMQLYIGGSGFYAWNERPLSKRVVENEGIIHHSDIGVQYCSKDYQELLRKNGFIYNIDIIEGSKKYDGKRTYDNYITAQGT